MRFRTLKYFFLETLLSLKRNGWMVLASVGTVAISLIILGSSLLLILNTNHIMDVLESNVEITVFLDGRLSDDEVDKVERDLKALEGVTKTEYVPKEQALENLKRQFGDKQEVFATLGEDNPLPDAYKVKVEQADLVASTAQEIGGIYGVTKVRYGQGVVERMFAITKWVRLSGMIVMISLGAGAVFLVSTTIRLTVFARRREINIMKFLGATDWFIRWPFLLEGLSLGLLGALLADITLMASYIYLANNIRETLAFVPLLADNQLLLYISLILLGVGGAIGIGGSFLSIHRHLKV